MRHLIIITICLLWFNAEKDTFFFFYRIRDLPCSFKNTIQFREMHSRKITVHGASLKAAQKIEKLLNGSAYKSWRTKQTINFNEQSERFRFLHFGGLLLVEDKGSFVGPNLTKGPIGPVHSSTTRLLSLGLTMRLRIAFLS